MSVGALMQCLDIPNHNFSGEKLCDVTAKVLISMLLLLLLLLLSCLSRVRLCATP